MAYDIFISYRRDGGAQYARILQLMLTQRGYKVFLDYDELKDGNFSEKIKKAIKETPIFIMVLSKQSMERCVNEGDWVREELMMAIEERKHIIPVNPDNTFDGIPNDVPAEIKNTIGFNQYSDISFGQALGVTVDMMIKDRLVPTLGQRAISSNVDVEYDKANETLKKLDARKKRLKRIAIVGVSVIVAIVIAIGFSILHEKKQLEDLKDMRNKLEVKYKQFNPYLRDDLTKAQMDVIDDILGKIVPVRPDTLWMSQFECTIRQWHGIKDEDYDESKKDYPMTNVSWGEVMDFILDLRDMTNIWFYMPSAEQWEYAAHGGSYNDTYIYAGSDNVDDVAWYNGNSNGQAHKSNGQQGKHPNRLDLFDMSGNVGEFCNTSIVTETGNVMYTVCGGNYTSPASDVMVSSRIGIDVNEKNSTTGFRLIIDKNQQ